MIDLTGYKLTFDDEFNKLSVSQSGAGTTWADIRSQWRFDRNSDIGFGKSSFMDAASGYDPFGISGGALSITASPDVTPYGYPGSWESGLISSKASFSQTYGYFEIRADFADTLGAWDAFWLLPASPVNTGRPGWQELDVVEHYGSDPGGAYTTIHTTDSTATPQIYSSHPTLAAGYHTYGMDWEKDTISFYVDGVLTGTKATPSDMHGPMYLLADLATRTYVGATGAPMVSKIDYIRAYSRDATASAVALGPVSAPDGRDPGLYGASSLGPTVAVGSQALAADTGASASDRITSNGAVTLTGTVTGAAGTTVQVYDGAAGLGSALLGTAGTWTFATTLTAGTHALRAVATDPNHASAVTATAAPITVVTGAPTIAVTSKAIAADGKAVLSGTVAGPDGTTVAVYNGSARLGAATLDGRGGWSYATALAPGTYAMAAVATDLAGNSASATPSLTVPAAPTATPPVPTPGTLVLNVAEDAFRGDVQFTVSVDGAQVGGVQTVTAQNRLGQSQDIALSGSIGAGTHSVGVNFLNDLYVPGSGDRNLWVNSITLGGITTAVNTAQWSQGTVNYQVAAPVTRSDTLVLKLSEDAYRGDAQFTVSVDGKQVGGVQTVTAHHGAGQTQDVTLTGYFGTGAHSVGVNFLNDLFNGSAATDRNLYVASISLDGTETATNAAQYSNGQALYGVQTPTVAAGGPASPLALSVDTGDTLIIDKDAGAGAAVTITGTDATVQFTAAADFHGSIKGLLTGDTLDLRSIGFAGNTSAGYDGGDSAGVLTVTDGLSTARLSLLGHYGLSDFHLASDGVGGTAVTFAR